MKGRAAQIIGSKNIIARLMAVFQIERREANTESEGAIVGRPMVPAAITSAGEISGAK